MRVTVTVLIRISLRRRSPSNGGSYELALNSIPRFPASEALRSLPDGHGSVNTHSVENQRPMAGLLMRGCKAQTRIRLLTRAVLCSLLARGSLHFVYISTITFSAHTDTIANGLARSLLLGRRYGPAVKRLPFRPRLKKELRNNYV